MRAPKVSITSKVKDERGNWRWSYVTVTANRIKHVEGARYYLRVNGRPEPVGGDPEVAYAAFTNRQLGIQAKARGIVLPSHGSNPTMIDGAIRSKAAQR
jgi:hypothetical protein